MKLRYFSIYLLLYTTMCCSWQILIPFLVVTCTFSAVHVAVNVPTQSLVFVVLLMSDFMALVSRQSFLHYVNLCKIHAIGESSPAMLSFRLGIVVHDLGTEALPSKAMASRLCHPGLDLDVPGLALSSKALAPRSWSCSATLWPCRPMPWQLAPRSWPCNARPWPCGPRPLHPGLAVPSQGLVVQGLGSQSLWSKILAPRPCRPRS